MERERLGIGSGPAMEFDKFSPQSFERFVQALVMHVFGAGLVVFGPGPDGGREATFEGKIPFPNASDGWDSYTVVQAKYKTKLEEPAENYLWLRAQAVSEMEKFTNDKRNLKKPNNYLLVTNVGLSSVAHVGGKDQMKSYFDGVRAHIPGLKHAIWSRDELISLLDNAENIRRSFCIWLTPSDVLATLISSLARPNLTRVAPLALARDLRQERDVRLRDAGQETETPVFLEDVFVDLPVETQILGHIVSSGMGNTPLFPEPEQKRTALSLLLALSQEKHDGLNVQASADTRQVGLPNRVVLLGGPGQGKSTLGQFMAQIFRVLIILASDQVPVSIPVRDAATRIKTKMAENGIDGAVPTRFPFRIDLPSYADELRKAAEGNKSISLLQHMTDRFQKSTDVEITSDDLRRWIGVCPNVMILDGLDEVPPSANRQAVIQSIESLWDDISLVQADTLMVVTSRPQGYSNDLSPKYWQHWELQPLEADEAINYASKLAVIRLSDEDRRAQTMDALRSAVTDAATRQLMTSPLQVAIMFGIAFLKGAIPSDRWDLFDRYYLLLRDRESQKPGPLGAIFKDYKRQIDLIHYTVGFYLQALSEVPGNANIFLTDREFQEVVEQALRDDGFEAEEINTVTSDIMRLTTQRLVLLATRTEHQVAFDVRSLQEYMASAQITIQSRNASTSARLRSIAGSAHWRHAFRISVSKIFSVAGLEQYRDDVLSIFHSLDNGDLGEGGRLGLLGARIAASVVLDGVTNSSPKFLKSFARRALQALDLIPAHFREVNLLISMYRPTLRLMYIEELTRRMSQGYSERTVGAWNLALNMMMANHSFAKDLVIKLWPTQISESFNLIIEQPTEDLPEEIISIIIEQQNVSGFLITYSFLSRWSSSQSWNFRSENHAAVFKRVALIDFGFLRAYQSHPFIELIVVKNGQDVLLTTKMIPIIDTYLMEKSKISENDEEWIVADLFVEFTKFPNAANLKHLFASMTDDHVQALLRGPQVNWVLQNAIVEVNLCTMRQAMIEKIETGQLGDREVWLAAEDRWKENSINFEDYKSWNENAFVHANVNSFGSPYFWALIRSGSKECDLGEVYRLIKVIKTLTDIRRRDRLCQALMFVFNNQYNRRSRGLFDMIYGLCLDNALERGTFFEAVNIALKGNASCWSSVQLCLRVNKQIDLIKNGYRPEVHWLNVVRAFNRNPSMRGLLPFVVYALCSRFNHAELESVHLANSAFHVEKEDSDNIKLSVYVLRAIFGVNSDADLVDSACAILSEFWSFGTEQIRHLLTLSAGMNPEGREKLLEQLWSTAVVQNHSEKSFLSSLVSRRAEGTETELLSIEVATELDLPIVPASFKKARASRQR